MCELRKRTTINEVKFIFYISTFKFNKQTLVVREKPLRQVVISLIFLIIYKIKNKIITTMKTKKIPVKIPLEGNGSIYDVLNQFINTMEAVTGGNVDLFCDFQGNITVHYEGDKEVLPTPSIKNNPYNLEQLLFPEEFETRADVKSATMRERKSSKL